MTERAASYPRDGYLAIDCAHARMQGEERDQIGPADRGTRAINVELHQSVIREAQRMARARARSHDRAYARKGA